MGATLTQHPEFPMQTRKMAARLQAATAGSGTRILFLSKAASGHGLDMPLDERIAERVDVFAFMLDRLAVPYRPPGR